MKLIKEKVFPIIISALKEDIGSGDITSSLLFEKDANIISHIVAKEEAVVAGMDVAKWIFDTCPPRYCVCNIRFRQWVIITSHPYQ